MFPDVFRKDVVGAEETFARCMEGGGLGASTSLNWGCAASPTSCRMRPSLVERKAPLCLIRASATRRSTWLQRKRGCQPCGPTPGPLANRALPGSPVHTPSATTPRGTPSPAGGAGVHHHMDLQPPIQEVQGCVLGAERSQGQPQPGMGVPGGGLGYWDGMREPEQDRSPYPPDNGVLEQHGRPRGEESS